MISLCCLIILSGFIVSCSFAPSGDAIQTAIAQTQVAQPTNTFVPIPTDTPAPEPTNSPVPLGELDIESILLMPGDLPSNYKLSVFYDEIPGLILFSNSSNIPTPDAVTAMDIDDTKAIDFYGDLKLNRVVVMLYNDLTQRDIAYQVLSDPANYRDKLVNPLSGVGDNAVSIPEMVFTASYKYVVFTRCKALVFIHTTGDTANYAQRLDERLTPLVCR